MTDEDDSSIGIVGRSECPRSCIVNTLPVTIVLEARICVLKSLGVRACHG